MTEENQIANIFNEVKNLIDITSSDNDWDGKYNVLKHLADYYRIRVDNNKELFCSELPDYNGNYLHVEHHANIIDLCEHNNVPYYVVRDIIKDYRDMSYLYGYKNDGNIYKTVDLTGYKDDYTRDILEKYNSKIDDKEYTTQQVYVIFKLVEKAYYEGLSESSTFSSVDNYLSLLELVSNEVSYMYSKTYPTETMEWNKFGGSLDFTYNSLHHEGLKKCAEDSIIRQIKNGDIDISEY